MSSVRSHRRSVISEAVAPWSDIARLLRGGDAGTLLPVIIPKHRRRLWWMLPLWFGGYALLSGVMLSLKESGSDGLGGMAAGALATLSYTFGVLLLVIGGLWWWRSSIVEIEQGTHGVLTRYGAVVRTLDAGRHYLWHPWSRVDFVVDTATEIPYSAPVMACPTQENVPLRSIEFFLKFRITDAVLFVRTIGAGNFDLVLSSAVQDAIRQRARQVRTERAYDLRGSDVADMQDLLNRQLDRYGVRITGCNIPDVQLPAQYQQHLATREQVAKERTAYEQEWGLIRKRRIDSLGMDIERAKKIRDARIVEVRAALNRAREEVAQLLERQETEAQRVRFEIETRGRSGLIAAENEARAQQALAKAYRDNRAVLRYELARRRLEVGSRLAEKAPRPVVVRTDGGTDTSALSTLFTAQLLPRLTSGDRVLNAGALLSAEDGGHDQR
ncbi:SPFH domain-containing protein [Streptomyces cellulosae]|uniref:SPFH domain-containing protein n=2 Tax=Streptomyces TaxID=1883 RepID=A0ABU3J3Y4_9ACTN|nr:SPFH domain-containing protein [Streptomyces sp. McG7]MBT2904521.1 SPFH domain-containing protein [Streptomyces sp. McG8]MDQ0487990.1 regulator of protease activity HflC (stomatin/prohibitin superfamily) [Streptomyces thermodiastaticus]MDT6969766.1 SPFH domain-containing protein [Streptomyces thermocarboxydus]MYQ32728.1 SPFH domain-containing protein [Streptomyces sp. SID4956]WSB42867.1 SPFH domain-containing protein [Streptomyces cellulosae]